MSIAESWETWNEGSIKEVARVYNQKYNLPNITFEANPDFVAFLSDGFLFTIHFRNQDNKFTEECKDALYKEVNFHDNILKELEE